MKAEDLSRDTFAARERASNPAEASAFSRLYVPLSLLHSTSHGSCHEIHASEISP